jgi:hypothetical protein
MGKILELLTANVAARDLNATLDKYRAMGLSSLTPSHMPEPPAEITDVTFPVGPIGSISVIAATLDRLAANDPAHCRIGPEPVGIVHVFVPGETTIDRLAKETDHAVPAVLAGAVVAHGVAGRCSQLESVVEFTVGEQTRVGCDPRAMERQIQAAVEIRPDWAAIQFTLRVPHPAYTPPDLRH